MTEAGHLSRAYGVATDKHGVANLDALAGAVRALFRKKAD